MSGHPQVPLPSSWGEHLQVCSGWALPLQVRWRLPTRRANPSRSSAPGLPSSHCPVPVSPSIGGERVILLSASAWGFLTVTTPVLAHLSSAHLASMAFLRVLTGLLQGEGPQVTSLVLLALTLAPGGVCRERVCTRVPACHPLPAVCPGAV